MQRDSICEQAEKAAHRGCQKRRLNKGKRLNWKFIKTRIAKKSEAAIFWRLAALTANVL
jgi:hypothetical protein